MFINKLRKFKKQIHSVRLTPNEKLDMKNTLTAFMKENPVRIENESRHILAQTGQSVFSFLQHKYMFASLIALLVVSLTGGVSYAAQDSLPGSPLYSIKNITEEVRAAATLSPKADADWDTRRIERRLEEANTLAAQGKLTTSTEAQLAQKIQTHIANAEQRIQKMEDKHEDREAADVVARLQASLALHQQLLTSLSTTPVTTTSTVGTTAVATSTSSTLNVKLRGTERALLNQLLQLNKKAEKIQERIENNEKVKEKLDEAAQHKIEEATKHNAEVKKFIAEKKSGASVEIVTAATAKLALSDASLVQAQTQFDQKLYTEAFVSAGKAALQAQEAKILIATNLNLPKIQQIEKGLLQEVVKEKKEEIKNIREDIREVIQEHREERKENVSSTIQTTTSTKSNRLLPRLKARIEVRQEHKENKN